MSKNGSITSFFKPAPKSSSSQQSGSSSQQILSPHSRELPIIASPRKRTPPPPPSSPFPASPLVLRQSPAVKATRDRNAVIRGSDDEDSDDFLSSDDDLPSLFSKPRAAVPVPGSRKDHNLCATPKAKRTAVAVFSPLGNQPKHKFDWNALMKHAQADNALEESEQRMEIALAAGSPTSATKSEFPDGIDGSGKEESDSLHDTMFNVLPDAKGSEAKEHREKVLLAVKRTQATLHRKEYQFFDDPSQQSPDSPGTIGVRSSFPKAAAKGPWKFLARDQGRADLFEDGVPFLVQSKLKNLPDEIYSWVVEEIPAVKSARLREEYLRLLEKCPEHAGRLIDEKLIVKLFRGLGASDRALDLTSQTKVDKSSTGRSYNSSSSSNTGGGQRDWTGLLAVLEILSRTSEGLTLRTLTSSIALLLRLGMDRVVHEDPDVASEYQETFWWLVKSIPAGCWDKACLDITTSLYNHVPEYTLRWDAVSSIPLTHPRLIDLRRRLAIAFLFDDPQRGHLPPDETFSIRSVIDRMDSDDTGIFTVDRRRQTDFFELASLIELLAVAIGDGNHRGEKEYNADVDELSKRLKMMTLSIHDKGPAFVSRLEAKGVLKDIERKLTYLTRTHPPVKASIFGIKSYAEEREEKEAEQRPKQQKFMERFFVGTNKPAGTGGAGQARAEEEEDDVDDKEATREREQSPSPLFPVVARVKLRNGT
ncbi:hypothetical protein V8F20_000758 [Naviculisporaceae sp. PSN 640]